MKLTISINYKLFLFTLVMELVTIPFVALFNTYTASNNMLMDILGVTLGLICGATMIYFMQKSIINFISQNLNISASTLGNKIYIAILFAMILGIMFFIQTQYNTSEYPSLIGGLSTGLSIFITLNLNLIISKIFRNYIYILDKHYKHAFSLDYFDICYISLIGFMYELCAYQISGLWLLYTEYRFFYGILSAILASLFGTLAVICTAKYLHYTPQLNIVTLDKLNQ